MKKTLLAVLSCFILVLSFSACSSKNVDATNYPKDPEDVRRLRHGTLTDGGLKILGGDEATAAAGPGLAVNSFLWRATLETLSFVPLASADPFGGVIITDWYENPETPGQRYKINALILDKSLRVDALKISVYKQKLDKGVWRDSPTDETLGRELEDRILAKAREMKIAQTIKK